MASEQTLKGVGVSGPGTLRIEEMPMAPLSSLLVTPTGTVEVRLDDAQFRIVVRHLDAINILLGLLLIAQAWKLGAHPMKAVIFWSVLLWLAMLVALAWVALPFDKSWPVALVGAAKYLTGVTVVVIIIAMLGRSVVRLDDR